ncbi:hypothetical protein WME95_27620 [Sorangium sp. So ce327]|uniref:hypothetical protein n=1 Tax=Sorangium sp. So ce327 TaxID=3133301 RepID=UPI003F5FD804
MYPDIGRLRALEAEWIQARRRAANLKHEAAGDGDPRGAHLVGLSLSGGGIRSATICLGFLKGLATVPTKSGEVILRYVDYMSSVSGGGWAGGALTARTSGPRPEGDAERERRFDPLEAASWNRLLDRIRLRGDYLIPGGIGLTANTLQPLLMIFVGAIANALSLLTAGFAAIVFLHHSSARSPKAFLARVVEHGVTAVVCHVDGARSLFFTTASAEPGTLPDAIAKQLPVLDLLVFVLALIGGVLLAALLVMYLGILFSWPSVHEAGTWLAARAALLVVLTGGLPACAAGRPPAHPLRAVRCPGRRARCPAESPEARAAPRGHRGRHQRTGVRAQVHGSLRCREGRDVDMGEHA